MDKVFNLSQLQPTLKRERTVVLTHGAFDLFHMGHFALLQESKKQGGILVVGVESSEDMHRYKGKGSIYPLNQRLEMISQIRCVDYVIPLSYEEEEFTDSYYWRLYFALRPNVVTFGKNFPFQNEVRVKCDAIGGEARQMVHQYSALSTTSVIQKVAQEFGDGTLSSYHARNVLRNSSLP